MNQLENYYGRIFTDQQLSQELKNKATVIPGMRRNGSSLQCNRCSSVVSKESILPNGEYYCRECIVFGRITSQSKLYYFPQMSFTKGRCLLWKGELTSFQEEVSQGLLESISQREDTLVHAVTGAGKTEMIYQAVAHVVSNAGCVCIASPRIDVCLELHRRLSQDFSCNICLTYGESEPYFRSPLIIATTHQLMRFYQAFDLLIIDEVDAFPFVDNEMLYNTLEQSLKSDGIKIFLTATSTEKLDKKVMSGQLKKLHLSRRFHANPLVVPKNIWLGSVQRKMEQNKLPPKFFSIIKQQRQTGFPLLIFFPNIAEGEKFTNLLRKYFLSEEIDFVSSTTRNRLDIVERFRNRELTILVSTTILERGVTFPCVDVFVILANHRLYTKSALVQISGRVGRSLERPTGQLLFLHDGISKSMRGAIREIKEMNQKGGFK